MVRAARWARRGAAETLAAVAGRVEAAERSACAAVIDVARDVRLAPGRHVVVAVPKPGSALQLAGACVARGRRVGRAAGHVAATTVADVVGDRLLAAVAAVAVAVLEPSVTGEFAVAGVACAYTAEVVAGLVAAATVVGVRSDVDADPIAEIGRRTCFADAGSTLTGLSVAARVAAASAVLWVVGGVHARLATRAIIAARLTARADLGAALDRDVGGVRRVAVRGCSVADGVSARRVGLRSIHRDRVDARRVGHRRIFACGIARDVHRRTIGTDLVGVEERVAAGERDEKKRDGRHSHPLADKSRHHIARDGASVESADLGPAHHRSAPRVRQAHTCRQQRRADAVEARNERLSIPDARRARPCRHPTARMRFATKNKRVTRSRWFAGQACRCATGFQRDPTGLCGESSQQGQRTNTTPKPSRSTSPLSGRQRAVFPAAICVMPQ